MWLFETKSNTDRTLQAYSQVGGWGLVFWASESRSVLNKASVCSKIGKIVEKDRFDYLFQVLNDMKERNWIFFGLLTNISQLAREIFSSLNRLWNVLIF